MSQLPLFKLAAQPKPAKPLRLGPNQQAVLARLERYGTVRVREAGRNVDLATPSGVEPIRASDELMETA